MKKISIRKLWGLVGLCLLGINAFQGYWLWSEYQTQQQHFATAVNSALLHATQQVQMAAASRLLPVFDSLRIRRVENLREVRVTALPDRDTLVIAVQPDWWKPDASWEKKLQQVDSVFRRELDRRGIRELYRLDTCPDHRAVHVFQTGNRREVRIQAEVQAENRVLVFTTDTPARDTTRFIQAKAPLDVGLGLSVVASFKRHNGYVLGRIAGMAAISLVLMLLTAGAFFYLLYIIRRQKQLADLKRDFINAITHELQTPIATAAAAVEALQHFNALEDPERTRAYLDITQEQLKQLSGMVDQTLQIATEERDHFPLQLQSVDVKTLVESLVQQARLAAGRPVSVSVEHHLEHPVQVDPVQLSRAIRNLLDNAIKYVLPSKTPVVCVATHPAGAGGWQISVKDNGPGIPEMYRARLFERFFRIPSEHNVKGFGLGLYVAQRIAREHGGQLLLQHSDPEGSTFVMRFR